jgi:hypothetical protein
MTVQPGDKIKLVVPAVVDSVGNNFLFVRIKYLDNNIIMMIDKDAEYEIIETAGNGNS